MKKLQNPEIKKRTRRYGNFEKEWETKEKKKDEN